jgi:predicted transcriptional regulator of viral defense system
MKMIDAFARIESLGKPILTTREVGVACDMSSTTASYTLARLRDAGLASQVSFGVWKIGSSLAEAEDVLVVLTAPYPSYLSMWTALFRHGMIEQVPRAITAVSLDRTQTIGTTIGVFEVHRIHHELFGGFEGANGIRAGMAQPEKALFDTVYLLSSRGGGVTLPELELPSGFGDELVHQWSERIPSRRLRTMVTKSVDLLLKGSLRLAA